MNIKSNQHTNISLSIWMIWLGVKFPVCSTCPFPFWMCAVMDGRQGWSLVCTAIKHLGIGTRLVFDYSISALVYILVVGNISQNVILYYFWQAGPGEPCTEICGKDADRQPYWHGPHIHHLLLPQWWHYISVWTHSEELGYVPIFPILLSLISHICFFKYLNSSVFF